MILCYSLMLRCFCRKWGQLGGGVRLNYGVSDMTIQRDLQTLENSGQVPGTDVAFIGAHVINRHACPSSDLIGGNHRGAGFPVLFSVSWSPQKFPPRI